MTEDNQDTIVNAYGERKEKQYFSKLVSIDEVLVNDANLSVSSYVEKEDKREVVDIVALNAEIESLNSEVVSLSQKLNEIIKEL